MVRLERSFIPWLSHFHIWKNNILSYVKYFKKANKWYSAKHDPNYLYTVLHCWFTMPFASPSHSFAVWLFQCLELLAIEVGGKCRIGATPSFLYRLCFPPPHLHLYYPLSLLPIRESESCLLYSLFSPSSPDFFAWIHTNAFPNLPCHCVTKFWPNEFQAVHFLGLMDRQSPKKKRAHPYSLFSYLGYESDGWSFSSHLENESHILSTWV